MASISTSTSKTFKKHPFTALAPIKVTLQWTGWIVACLDQIEVSEAVESIAIHVNDMTIHEKDVTLVSFNGDMIQVKGRV